MRGRRAADVQEVTFRLEGETVTTRARPDEFLLDAAAAAGLDLPSSCREGMCTACTGELIDGDVDDSRATALSRDQRADGYVLLCCSSPEADCEVRAGERVQDELLGLDAL